MKTLASELTVIQQAGGESRPRIAALAAAVYPPEILALMPWRDVQSARSHHRILVLDNHDVVVGAAGFLVREALLDGSQVQIGGVGGVMTLPARQGVGIGRLAMEAVDNAMQGFPMMRFALLFCESNNTGFYAKLGWNVFDGIVEIEQESGKQAYNIMKAMVLPVHGAAPNQGRLDVCGLPW